MPRVTLGIDKREIEIKATITEYIARRGVKVQTMAKSTGLPLTTVYRDIRCPDKIPINRIWAYADYLRIPREKLVLWVLKT